MTEEEPNEQAELKFVPAVGPQGPLMSINEIVSYNLMRARRSNAWTQSDVAGLLEKYTGRAWSNASVSAAERAWQGGRPRKFDANELIALTKIFDVPLGYFFLPPEDEHANKFVSMRQFENGEPLRGPEAMDRHEYMALLPTATLLETVGAHDPGLEYVARMKRLVKRYLGLDWLPGDWTVLLHRDPVSGEMAFGSSPADEDAVDRSAEQAEHRERREKETTWPLPYGLKESDVLHASELLEESQSWQRAIEQRLARLFAGQAKALSKEIAQAFIEEGGLQAAIKEAMDDAPHQVSDDE